MNASKREYPHSANLNGDTNFPYLVLNVVNDNSYPKNPGFRVMHWHEDVQFIYVQSGGIAVHTLYDRAVIHAGEGIFINKKVIHYVGRLENCHYYSFIFPDYFLGFYTGSPVIQDVENITENPDFPYFVFSPNVDWQSRMISILTQLVEEEKKRTKFYEYSVLLHLCTLWLIFQKNITFSQKQNKDPVALRMQKMLRYIEAHFTEDISLSSLAESANISKAECARCFKVSLHTSPYKYIMELRLSRAAQLLKDTDKPIGEIASSVGFHQFSHFGKCFREKTGYSPKEYRKIVRVDRTP